MSETLSELNGVRKAAVLLVQMGKERSAKVLASMRDAEVEELTAEIARLDAIDSNVAERVVAEFQEMVVARKYYSRGGLAFAQEVLEASLGKDKAHDIIGRLNASMTEMPFQFL